MLPTLYGRWTTRIMLFILIALPVTLIWSLYLRGWNGTVAPEPFWVVLTLLWVGLILDCLYIFIQKFRWERDWPFSWQFLVSIMEFGIVLLLVYYDLLPYLHKAQFEHGFAHPYWLAWIQFAIIFIPSFYALLGPIQLFLLRWRYKGGELGRL